MTKKAGKRIHKEGSNEEGGVPSDQEPQVAVNVAALDWTGEATADAPIHDQEAAPAVAQNQEAAAPVARPVLPAGVVCMELPVQEIAGHELVEERRRWIFG